MVNQTIYKKDSSGKVRYLTISSEGAAVVQTSGVVGTSNPVENISQCEAKNVGKTNATTAEEQAIVEARAKLVQKLKTGYFETSEEAQSKGGSSFLLPMLAKDFKKEIKKVKYPCYVQPKLDGMRCMGNFEEKLSRKGEEITTLDHIKIPELDFYLDGELYSHGLSFQEVIRLIKKYRQNETEKIKYHVYDIIDEDLSFRKRYEKLCAAVSNHPHIEIVPCQEINNHEELIIAHKYYIAQGYEGTMVRHSEEGYAINKRSSQLLKFKDFLDEVYEVVDIDPSESRPEQGVVVCLCGKTNQTFKTGMKFSHAEREEILVNKQNYIGKMAEVRFFELTDGGLPRFPVCVGFRID
jgi:DNA ligase 1